jgi:enoyl-[acyl-carrier protein] reductase II
MNTKLSDRFFKRGREFFGVKYPFICGAMTWVSDPKLVATVCNAGGFACLAGGNNPPEILKQQIEETRRLTDKPFGMNLITIAPPFSSLPGVFPVKTRSNWHRSPVQRSSALHQRAPSLIVCFVMEQTP